MIPKSGNRFSEKDHAQQKARPLFRFNLIGSWSSAADLKFLSRRGRLELGTSNGKAALGSWSCGPLCFRSSCQEVLRWITSFGSGAGGRAEHDPDRLHRARPHGLPNGAEPD